MERRDIILIAVLSTLACLISMASAFFCCYWCNRRNQKRQDAEVEAMLNRQSASSTPMTKQNGAVNIKTPLIRTKSVG